MTSVESKSDNIIFTINPDLKPLSKLCPETMGLSKHIKGAESRLGDGFVVASEFPDECPIHGLILAIHIAFSYHWKLKLRADDIWLAILQGVAQHINMNPEKYRTFLVSHDKGKELISVTNNDLLTDDQEVLTREWRRSIGQLATETRNRTEGKATAKFTSRFSTTDPVAQAAQDVALMDSVSAFFDFEVRSFCGIPQVQLLGTIEDWAKLNQTAGELPWTELGLDVWKPHVLEITQALLTTAMGKGSVEFWRNIYKIKELSGGASMNGWVARLFPYTKTGYAAGGIRTWEANRLLTETKTSDFSYGISPDAFPSGVSSVPFVWRVPFDSFQMRMHAGFADPDRTSETNAVSVSQGWAVEMLTDKKD